jgi:hypothetical protein
MKRSLIILCAILFISVKSYAAVPLLHVSSDNPAFLADPAGNIVHLGGFYNGMMHQDNMVFCTPSQNDCTPTSIIPQSTDNLSHSNNVMRLFIVDNSKDTKGLINPTIYKRSLTPGANDGLNKFDMTQFNIGNLVNPDPNSDAYFERLRARVIQANNLNQYVVVMLFNSFNWDNLGGRYLDNPAWNYGPYNATNNINGVNGDTNADGSGTELQFTAPGSVNNNYQKAYVAQVIDTLNDLDNVIWEICNECLPSSVAWQNDLITFVRNYENNKPKKHPIALSANSDYSQSVQLASSADVLVIGGPGTDSTPVMYPSRVVWHDTDHSRPCEVFPTTFAWKLFMRGQSLMYFDCPWVAAPSNNPALADRIGQSIVWSKIINLKQMVANQDCSTTFCLSSASEHLLYLPNGGSVTVNLAGSNWYAVEWFNPSNYTTQVASFVTPGSQTLISPYGAGEAVVRVKDYGIAVSGGGSSTPTGPIYDSLTQFSSVQGQNGWFYLNHDLSQMTWNSTYGYWQGPNLYQLNYNDGQRPSMNGFASIRRWKAPSAGTWRVRFETADYDTAGGNGVIVTLKKNNATTLYTRTLANAAAPAVTTIDVDMAANDTLESIVSNNGDTQYDNTTTLLTIQKLVTNAPTPPSPLPSPTVLPPLNQVPVVPPSPTIGVTPTTLGFSIQENGSSLSQNITLSNTVSGSTLNWSVSDNVTWLSVSPSSGTNNSTLVATVNPNGLSVGTYTAAITITGTGATNTPQTVNVNLTITAVPPATLTLKQALQNAIDQCQALTTCTGKDFSDKLEPLLNQVP